MNIARKTRVLGLAVALLGAGAVSLQAQQVPPAGAVLQEKTSEGVIVQGVTKPYVPAKPWFNSAGTVLEVPVEKGQTVKKGDVLIRQDDRQEKAELAKLQAEANSNVRVEAADADLKIKQDQLKRLEGLQQTGGANPFEIEEARSKVIYGEAQAKIARLDLEKAKRDAERQGYKVEQMTIRSPVDGRIEMIEASVGDITDPQKPVISVVQNDPLKVQFFLPIVQSNKLKVGQDVQVRYPGEQQWLPAKVTVKSPLADAASDTQEVNVEMKNADGRDSGMQVQVRLPANIGPATPSGGAFGAADQKQ